MTQDDTTRLLLVNDNPSELFALHTILSDLQATTLTARSGREALALLLQQDFALIILDVKMPGMDGFETAGLIRQRPSSKHTPIIFLTSHRATDLDRARGYELGAVDYLFMPVPPGVLKSKVKAFIELDKNHRYIRQQDVELTQLNCQLKQQLEHITRLNEVLRAEITAREQAEAIALQSETAHLIVQNTGDFVALLEAEGRWLYASPSYHARFGTDTSLPGGDFFDLVHADDRERMREAFCRLVASGEAARMQYRVLLPTSGERFLESEASLVHDTSGKVAQVVMVSRDITERKKMEAYVLHLSYHDPLTGLPNRALLEDRMKQVTAYEDRRHSHAAVLFIDLDRFKDINDSLGHAAGDRLLQEVAERLSRCVREEDTVARLGGDEFVALLVGIRDVHDAALIANKIIATVSAPCRIEGRELRVSPSIGIAIFPNDGKNIEALMRNADTAMYYAKQAGRSQFSFFTPQMNETASRRLTISSALRRAIEQGEFALHYQPRVCATSGEIRGFEALIRWPQPNGEWIPPSQFIPIAEETGMIKAIDEWVIREACYQVQRWSAEGLAIQRVAVNVSARQFRRDGVVQTMKDILGETGIPPTMLEAELTESTVMADPVAAAKILHEIRGLGVHIAIDDFGTGYSSLACLKRFPVDTLKIDAAFVRDIATDPDDAVIVSAIIALAHHLNLTVVAEGVETADQMAFLVEHGCDELQGYYFSKPLPQNQARALLASGCIDVKPLNT
ncbi:MAG: two-component system response regulator [Gammaproteobacteria bacterium]